MGVRIARGTTKYRFAHRLSSLFARTTPLHLWRTPGVFADAAHGVSVTHHVRLAGDVPPHGDVAETEGAVVTSVGIELFSPDYWDNSLGVNDALRAEAPVHCAALDNGMRVWVIGRFEEARRALVDPSLSKDSTGLKRAVFRLLIEAGQQAEVSNLFGPNMLFAEGEAHARLRKLVSAKFTHARVKATRPRIEQITTDLLDALSPEQPIDVVEQVAFPLPVMIICELLGIPRDNQADLRRWTAALMRDVQADNLPASRAMEAYFTELIEEKKSRPGDDLLSALVSVAQDEDRLAQDELMSTLFLLFVAGHETTTNMIGNAVRWLIEDPASWQLLGREPERLPAALEEVMRYDSPVRVATYRYTTEPVTYDGVLIPAGEIVLVSLQSANRDPARFPQADRLELGRKDARHHLTFGHGIHYCLGAPLGRLEGEIALGQLTRRFPHARLAVPSDHLRRQRSSIMNGFERLPVLLNP